jgi:hypothetical protein
MSASLPRFNDTAFHLCFIDSKPYFPSYLERISKIGSAFMAGLATAKKRNIRGVCEHFLPLRNAGLGA